MADPTKYYSDEAEIDKNAEPQGGGDQEQDQGTDDGQDDEESSDTQPQQQEVAQQPAPPAAPVPQAPDNSISAAQSVKAFAPNATANTQQPAKSSLQQASSPGVLPGYQYHPTADEYNQRDMQFAQDLASRQVSPETYKQMFGKKDTLGKIGTLFGLLVSSIGSGLTRQPNQLMEMMNKEIERDMDAQQKNRTNSQNFLNMTYNHEMQQSQIRQAAYQNQLLQAQTGMIPAQTAQMLANANAINAQNAGLAEKNRTFNHMAATAAQHLSDIAGNNPQAQQVLNDQVIPAIMQKMHQNNQDAANMQNMNTVNYLQKHQNQQQQGQAEVPKFDSGVDYNALQKKINLGKLAPDLPGVIPPSDVPEVQNEAKGVASNRAILQIWDNSFKELANSITANKFNPQRRAALIDAVATRISRDTGAMSTEQASKILDGMFPTISDKAFPGNIEAKYQKGVEHFAGMEAATPALDRYGLKTAFPQMSMPTRKGKQQFQKQSSAANSDIKVVNGVTYKRGPDGRAIRVGQTASQ